MSKSCQMPQVLLPPFKSSGAASTLISPPTREPEQASKCCPKVRLHLVDGGGGSCQGGNCLQIWSWRGYEAKDMTVSLHTMQEATARMPWINYIVYIEFPYHHHFSPSVGKAFSAMFKTSNHAGEYGIDGEKSQPKTQSRKNLRDFPVWQRGFPLLLQVDSMQTSQFLDSVSEFAQQ